MTLNLCQLGRLPPELRLMIYRLTTTQRHLTSGRSIIDASALTALLHALPAYRDELADQTFKSCTVEFRSPLDITCLLDIAPTKLVATISSLSLDLRHSAISGNDLQPLLKLPSVKDIAFVIESPTADSEMAFRLALEVTRTLPFQNGTSRYDSIQILDMWRQDDEAILDRWRMNPGPLSMAGSQLTTEAAFANSQLACQLEWAKMGYAYSSEYGDWLRTRQSNQAHGGAAQVT
ncbi:hypothetical protein LTR56_015320 [Elasticomyces elasticus]|nr:hypothetical protein LTR56_015320 [Elasticomyces elasticus]